MERDEIRLQGWLTIYKHHRAMARRQRLPGAVCPSAHVERRTTEDAAQTRRRGEVISFANNPPIAVPAHVGSAESDGARFQLAINRLELLTQTIRQWTVLVVDKAA